MRADDCPEGRAHILAIEVALPERAVTNQELAERHPEWRMAEVAARAGVETRHWAAEDQTSLDLAERACRGLVDRGVDLSSVQALLFCTQSPDYPMPPNACLLQDRLGLPMEIAAFDYNLACSGYVYGLYLAKALIDSHQADRVLLVTAETYSKLMSLDDRGPATLFGDAAAATVVAAGFDGLEAFALATDGARFNRFWVEAGGARCPSSAATRRIEEDEHKNRRSREDIVMHGAGVFDFVRKEIPGFTRNLLKKARLSLDDVDLVVFHQASKVAIDYLYAKLEVPEHKRYSNLARVGNTVSASIPLALHAAAAEGVLRSGMRVLLVAFGVGMSWGGAILRWR